MEKNGQLHQCPIADEFLAYRQEAREVKDKVVAMQTLMANLTRHSEHLTKLDTIAISIGEMRDTLIESATGRDQISRQTAEMLISQQVKYANLNSKILAGVIVVLLFVIAFLLTGEKLGLINQLHR